VTLFARAQWVGLSAIVVVAAVLLVLVGSSRADAAAPDDAWSVNAAAPDTVAWRSVAWSPSAGVFVAVGTNTVMTSPDGVTWTARTIPAGGWDAVTWSPDLALFAAVATSGANRVATSPDGVTWTAVTPVGITSSWSAIVWSPGRHQFLATAVSSPVLSSADGVTWTGAANPGGPTLTHGLTWSPTLSLFVMVTNNGAAASPDGVTWTAGNLAAGAWRGVAWSPARNLFVAVGIGGANAVATSPDGLTWTAAPTPIAADLSAVVWSPEQEEFVAVGQGAVLSSPDGLAWSAVTNPAPANSWNSVVWSAGSARYVAVSTDGAQRTMVGIVPALAPTTPPVSDGDAAPAVTPDPELAATGADMAPVVIAGALAIMMGFGMLLPGIRRRRA